jgi:hypothetical protein
VFPSLSSVKEAVELPMTHPEMYEDIGIKVREDGTAANVHCFEQCRTQ